MIRSHRSIEKGHATIRSLGKMSSSRLEAAAAEFIAPMTPLLALDSSISSHSGQQNLTLRNQHRAELLPNAVPHPMLADTALGTRPPAQKLTNQESFASLCWMPASELPPQAATWTIGARPCFNDSTQPLMFAECPLQLTQRHLLLDDSSSTDSFHSTLSCGMSPHCLKSNPQTPVAKQLEA